MYLQSVNTLTNTGEMLKSTGMYIAITLILFAIGILVWRKKKQNDENNNEE